MDKMKKQMPKKPMPPKKPVGTMEGTDDASAERDLRDLAPEASMDTKMKKKYKEMGYKSGGYVKSADGCAQRGKTKGRMI